MLTIIISALSLGLLGSFHCAGMCGPIALALPVHHLSTWAKVKGILFYNFGRIVTYSIFGAMFGLLGKSFVIAGFQQITSITLGALILIIILLPEFIYSKFKITSPIYTSIGKLKGKLGILFKKNNLSSLFFIGILNGLLPCGLVYLGIAGAIATGESLSGAIFMASFGLGTAPAMLALAFFSSNIKLSFRNKINKAMPYFISVMAILLILRGMNLGIPYVSPQLSSTKAECNKCCHKK